MSCLNLLFKYLKMFLRVSQFITKCCRFIKNEISDTPQKPPDTPKISPKTPNIPTDTP